MITTYAQAVNSVDDEAVLFAFDDCSWPFTSGCRLVLERPVKHPANPVLRRGGPGGVDEVSCRLGGTVLRENGVFRMWYVGTRKFGRHPQDIPWDRDDLPLTHEPGQFPKIQRLCYAESEDGIHWTKPNLGAHSNALETENMEDNASFVVRTPDTGEYVIVVTDHPPGRWDGTRYHLKRFMGCTRIYSSPDGIRLTPLSDGDDCPRRFEGGAFFHFQGRYSLGGQDVGPILARMAGDEPRFKRTMITMQTPDWRRWPEGAAVSPFMAGYGDLQNHAGVVCTPRGNVCLGLTGRFQPAPGGYRNFSADLGFAISNNGLHWREPVPNRSYVEHDQEKSWDPDVGLDAAEGTFMRQSGPMLQVGDETWIYYSAATMGGNTNYRNYQIGLMTRPRDRFGYMELFEYVWKPECWHDYRTMDIHPDDIMMWSCPIECDGTAGLYLNFISPDDDTKPTTVQLYDGDRLEALPGYSHEECKPLSGDELRLGVAWEQGRTLPTGRRFTIQLRAGKKSRIYAMYIAG